VELADWARLERRAKMTQNVRRNKTKERIKAVALSLGLVLGAALLVTGIVRVVTSDASILSSRSVESLQRSIDADTQNLEELRTQENPDISQISDIEARLFDTEAELARVNQGFYDDMKREVWLENLPLLIAGASIIAVAVVIYKYV
jgi:hypothetical protein